ncbi:piggyBac transposable element-derived protein 4-like [Macrosteles quadrilineatus]|uniref:piggyBac transposable element-derived protein 4-like n=1 Tax=Macrosteles quadrilineatus TaxID=74068 RepID=UPI0023E2C4CF|nr:piggyBac transposable element-derived protein 4-like [Macrosteles quadrilineatus]
MANPDDPDFNVFVNDLMNASFSSAYVDMDIDDSDREDALIYNNPGESESDGEVSQPPQPLALPLDSQPPVTPLQPPALPGSTTDTSHTTYDDLINDIGLTNTSFSSIIDVMEIDSDRKDISVTSPPVSLPTPVTPLPTPLPTPVTPLPAPLPTSVTPLPTPLPTPVTPLPAPLPTSVTPLPAPLPTPITDPQPPARAKRSRGVKRAPVTPPAPQPTPVTTPQPPAPAKRSRRVTRTPVTPPPAPQAQPPPDSADLPTAQLSDWVDVTDNDPGPSHTIPIYSVSAGPVLPAAFDSESEPIDYFKLFFNDNIFDLICTETNLYANKRKAQCNSPRGRINTWKDITPVELKAFFATIINMGLIPLPSIESYYSTTWIGRIPFFRDVFNRDEFLNIFWNLHFNHKDTNNAVPRGFLVSPIVDHMKEMCRLFYNPSEHISVDESTISFKGKVSFRIYNPNKPTKFGLKIFVVSDSKSGYLYDFIPYYGKETLIPDTTLLKTTQIVKVLAQSVAMKDPVSPATGLHVYTDRYYTSPEIAEELLGMGCFLTGTVMPNRVGLPPRLKAIGKGLKKGEIVSKRKENTLVLSWKDKRTVHMLSTFSKGSKHNTTDVPSKWPNKPPTAKPHVILDYIKHMGGVDHTDHFISSYQFMRRTRKWYRKMFFWLFEVAIVNSYIMYKDIQQKHNKNPMSHRQFRTCLVKSLVEEKLANRPIARKRGRPVYGPPNQRLDGNPHFMDRKEKGANRCVVCFKNGRRRETIYFCKTCDSRPALHPDTCFEQFHTMAEY